MFWPSIEQAAVERGWRLVIVAKAAALLAPTPIGEGPRSRHRLHSPGVAPRWIVRRPSRPDLILYINAMNGVAGDAPPVVGAGRRSLRRGASTRSRRSWCSGRRRCSRRSPSRCLETNFFDPSACSRPIDEVVEPRARGVAADIAASIGADILDLNGILCDADGMCPMIADNTLMYRDAGHISNVYSTHFATVFGDALSRYLE